VSDWNPNMALPDRLQQRSAAIYQRWLDDTLATYSQKAAAVFGREQDPFANPVGHALRTGTHAAWEALLAGKDASEICACLEEIIKIRAVQEFSPSQALSFVYLLKEVLRTELSSAGRTRAGQPDPLPGEQWMQLERQIDQIALGLFDIYVRCRGQLYELKVNEVKRSVAMLLECAARRSGAADENGNVLEPAMSAGSEAERGGGR
jgi:hypothetical protein